MSLYSASKAVILVNQGAEVSYLMSIKRDPGSDNEGKLEFPGGRFEVAESPRAALLRELAEEERTGNLAQLADDRANLYFRMLIGNAQYFLFPFHVSVDEFSALIHHPDESFGFELVLPSRLAADPQVMTPKTGVILETWDFTAETSP